MEQCFEVKNLEEFTAQVQSLGESFVDQQVVLLSGDLGAGKTQFVKSLLGENPDVQSPSFALHNRYEGPKGVVDHVDLYRLESEEELESTGFWDLFTSPKAWIFIEWAERLQWQDLPPPWQILQVRIERGAESESHRKISLQSLR